MSSSCRKDMFHVYVMDEITKQLDSNLNVGVASCVDIPDLSVPLQNCTA